MRKILFFTLFLISLHSNSEENNIAFINQHLSEFSEGPNLSTNCQLSEDDHNQSEKKSTGSSFVVFKTKNDAFAVPVSALRNKTLIIWDMGETHGGEVNLGHQLKTGHEASLLYGSNLYTDIPITYQFTDYLNREQNFTSEQILTANFNNFKTDESLKYSIGLGILDYNSTDSSSPWLASTQQTILHNSLDSALGINLIDIESVESDSEINGTGLVVLPEIGKNINLNQSTTITPYAKARITTIAPANNISFGGKINSTFNPSKSTQINIGLDVPVTIYKDVFKEEMASFIKPKFGVSAKHKNLTIGYELEIPFGNWRGNIPQNIPTYAYMPDDLREVSDQGEMGAIFIRLEK